MGIGPPPLEAFLTARDRQRQPRPPICPTCLEQRRPCRCGREERNRRILLALWSVSLALLAAAWLAASRIARGQCPPPADTVATCYSAAELAPFCSGTANRFVRVTVQDPARGVVRPRLRLAPVTGCGRLDSTLAWGGLRATPRSWAVDALTLSAWPDSSGRATFRVRALDYYLSAFSRATIDSIDNATGNWPELARLPVRGIAPLLGRIHGADAAVGETLEVVLRFGGAVEVGP